MSNIYTKNLTRLLECLIDIDRFYRDNFSQDELDHLIKLFINKHTVSQHFKEFCLEYKEWRKMILKK